MVAVADDREKDWIQGVVRYVEDIAGGRGFAVSTEQGGVWVRSFGISREVERLLPGDLVRVYGRLRTPRGYGVLGASDGKRYIAAKGAHFVMSVEPADVMIARSAHEHSWRRWPTQVQRSLSAAAADRNADVQGTSLVKAMVFGDKGSLTQETTDAFRRAGIAHLLAVSGLHVAVVVLFVYGLVRRLWAVSDTLCTRVPPVVAAAVLACGATLAYAVIAGARTAIVRAAIVCTIVLVGIAAAHRARVIDALGVAAIAILAHRPSALFEPSFQLSFAATATLALVFGGRSRLDRIDGDRGAMRALSVAIDGVWSVLRASFWATFATAPFVAMAFGELAIAGLWVNLIAVPLTELFIVPVGLVSAVLCQLSSTIFGPVLDVVIVCAGTLEDFARWVTNYVDVTRVSPPNAVEFLGFVILWIAVVACRAVRFRLRASAAVVGAGIMVASVCGHEWATAQRQELRVTFVDVGQGDATVLELPGGATWLIDAGGLPFVPRDGDLAPIERRRRAAMPARLSLAKYLAYRRIRRIELAVVTHPHPDHYAGLHAVADIVPIRELWIPNLHDDQRVHSEYLALLMRLAWQGTVITAPRLGLARTTANVELWVHGPRYDSGNAAVDPVLNINDNSLVVAGRFAGRQILFTGDIEYEGEERLVRTSSVDLRSDIVKVPHHGSRTSSTRRLVDASRPSYAVVSCGLANRFGFPNGEVAARWQSVGTRLLRTDLHGSVTVTVSPDGALDIGVHHHKNN